MGENFGIFKSFGDRLFEGETPTNLGLIGSTALIDSDVLAFFNRVIAAGGSLTSTEQDAVTQLVLQMKALGIWASMKAIYPMVGSSAAACAQNLKSASFTGTFSSGWTFASTGVTPNGTSAFMDTNLNVQTHLSTSSAHLSIYSRTNVNQPSYDFDASAFGVLLFNNIFYVNLTDFFQYNASTSLADTLGMYIGTRINATNVNGYKNNSKVVNNVAQVGLLSNANMILGAYQGASYFSSKQYAFCSVGDGLDDTQASDFYTAVQAFQTTLGRQV
jgi:hypothetical protein